MQPVQPFPDPTPQQPLVARGHNGTVVFDGQWIEIQRTGALARISVGKGTKRIHIGQVTSVQIKPAGQFINGFVAFGVGGGNERRSKFGRQTVDAANDENSVVFTYAQRGWFQWLATFVQRAQAAYYAAPQGAAPVTPVSVGEELQRLADLLNQGLLTRDEFDQQKRRLLGG